MIPGPWSVPHWANSREDRASRELRAYLRWEHNAEIGWLLAQIRHRREPFGRRLLAWIRRRKAEASAERAVVQPVSRDSKDVSKAAGPGGRPLVRRASGQTSDPRV